jgi:hypothetical protein
MLTIYVPQILKQHLNVQTKLKDIKEGIVYNYAYSAM